MESQQNTPAADELMNAKDVLGADDIEFEDVPVPEWTPRALRAQGIVRKIRIVGLSSRDRDAWEASLVKTKPGKGGKLVPTTDTTNMRAKLVVLCAVDQHFVRLFKPEQADQLGNKASSAVDRLYDVAQRLSKISDTDVEEIAGNSEDGPTASS